MLGRENIGGFWRIRARLLPPPAPPPEILTQIQKSRATLSRHPCSLSSSEDPFSSLGDRSTQSKPIPILTEYWASWMRRSFAPREVQKEELSDPRTKREFLDQILSPSYTVALPSSLEGHSLSQHQALAGEDSSEKSQRPEPIPSLPEHGSDERRDLGLIDADIPYDPSSDHHDDNIDTGNADKSDDRSESAKTILDSIDEHAQASLENAESAERYDGVPFSDSSPESIGFMPHEPHGTSNERPGVLLPPNSEHSPSSHSLLKINSGMLSQQAPSPGKALGGVQQSASASTEQLRVPTSIHHQALALLASDELVALIKEFLQQNFARFNDFHACRQIHPAIPESGLEDIETIFSPAWDNEVELKFLKDAIVWLDTLLAPFRAEILAEDLRDLKPRIEHAVRDFENTGVSSRLRTETSLSNADNEITQHFSDSIARIQASNKVRAKLLQCINIDVSAFENLLLSAENVRYRRNLGREYGQKDDLVDGLRRIYSTISCTTPVGLSEHDWIEQPPQPHTIIYGDGPFSSYKLPDRPEIFDHHSISISRFSGKGAIGIQLSEQQSPLSQAYWRNLHQELSETIAAQRLDRVGSVKLSKNPDSMNRDWNAFYGPIYGTGMANYVKAAAQRIESETNDQSMRKAGVVNGDQESAAGLLQYRTQNTDAEMHSRSRLPPLDESLQDDSRRSSTEGTDSSVMTTKLDVGAQDDRKRSKFCMNVNKPGGCSDRNNCGAELHSNEGRHCRHGENCNFGASKCAYIHGASSNTDPSQLTSLGLRGSMADINPCEQDLRQILAEVLKNPRSFRVCNYVNLPQGCRSGANCQFNHTLEGLACVDYQKGICSRGSFDCPLKHIRSFDSIPGPPKYAARAASNYAPVDNVRFYNRSSSNQNLSAPSPPTLPNFESYHEVPKMHPFRTSHGPQLANGQFHDPSPLDTQQSDPFDHAQPPEFRGLPLNTPTRPRNRHAQLPNMQPAFSKIMRNNDSLNSDDRYHSLLKRKGSFDRPRGGNGSLVARMTRDGRPLLNDGTEEHCDDESGQEYSGHSSHDQYGMDEVHGDNRPRKRQDKGRKWHNPWSRNGADHGRSRR